MSQQAFLLLSATDYDTVIMGAMVIIASLIIFIVLIVTLELRKP